MQAHLTRWGSSLGLRIPKSLAGRFRLTEGMRVTLEAEGDHIVISMPKRYTLAALLADTTPDSMHGAFDWGGDTGREIVD
jgi:antitoxin MazE